MAHAAGKLALLSKNPLAIFGAEEKNFSPDLYRQPLNTLILSVLLSFLLFACAGLFICIR
jgi:hypothetical protein